MTHRYDPFRWYHSRLEWTWEWWQWRGTWHSPKLQYYWNLPIRLFSILCRTLVGEVLLLSRNAVGIFSSPSCLGQDSMCKTRRVSGKIIISQSYVLRQLHSFGNCIWNCQLVSVLSLLKILQNFRLTHVYSSQKFNPLLFKDLHVKWCTLIFSSESLVSILDQLKSRSSIANFQARKPSWKWCRPVKYNIRFLYLLLAICQTNAKISQYFCMAVWTSTSKCIHMSAVLCMHV